MTSKPDSQENPSGSKRSSGWFAAGRSFQHALLTLSDGAFKLFSYVALEAERQTGRFEATQTELARILRKSRRAIGKYAAELEQKGVCAVTPATNQYARNTFEIADEYWPYHRSRSVREDSHDSAEDDPFVAAVRDSFLKTGCTRGKFSADDARTARALMKSGVTLELLQDAMNLGACRKYDSWLSGRPSEQIASLAYFEPLVSEIRQHPLPDGYSEYLKSKVLKLSQLWEKAKGSAAASRGDPDAGVAGQESGGCAK